MHQSNSIGIVRICLANYKNAYKGICLDRELGYLRRKTMIEQTKVKPGYSGICKFCRGEFDKANMTQHLKNCKERMRLEAETAKSPKDKKFVVSKMIHIMLEGRYNPIYCIH